ncbi:UNVERIFIED_CONTAM: hypothetical protein Slati_3324000 [Sesamum latifolium]|uniref:DUF4283 domain-containing protein n=1 Tax=Sesamum latifolium TaxID=2727402 RepID=A0AAW2UCA0_9LAMI
MDAKNLVPQTMRIFKWSPTFTPEHESSIVPVLVNFFDLPAHLFRKDALFTIASFVGTPLQIGDSTFNKSKLSRARVCIEIDLLKPLVKEVDLQIHSRTFVQKVEYEQVPQYCSLCKHVGHHDSECFTKGTAQENPRRRYVPISVLAPTTVKENANQMDVVDETEINHAENVVPIAENESFNGVVVGNVEHVIVEHDTVENESLNGAAVGFVEHAIVKHTSVENEENGEHAFIENDSVGGNEAVGAMILRPNNFVCNPIREMKWFNVDSVLRLHQALKRLGIAIEGIPEDVEDLIKVNSFAVKSAILYQKCVLIYDRVSRLLLKPLDERSPPIATRTRRRKKGKNLTESPDDEVHYF